MAKRTFLDRLRVAMPMVDRRRSTAPVTVRFGVGIVTACAITAMLACPTPAAAKNKVLLISWDGVGRNILDELLYWQRTGEVPHVCPSKQKEGRMPQPCGEYLSCLPNLCRFQIIDSRIGPGKSLTRPQHAQMLSGYGPATTGIVGNSGRSKLPTGFSIYERLDQALGVGTGTGHVAGRKFVSRGVVVEAKRDGALDVLDGRGGPDRGSGANTTEKALKALDEIDGDVFLLFVHYKQADVYGHTAGSTTARHREAIEDADAELGVLIHELAARGILDDTAIYVTTDHGFNGNQHLNRTTAVVHTWIASRDHNLVTDIDATVLDVVPTILDEFGIDFSGFQPPLEGVSLLSRRGPAR